MDKHAYEKALVCLSKCSGYLNGVRGPREAYLAMEELEFAKLHIETILQQLGVKERPEITNG